MKITKTVLKNLIQEEIKKSLSEGIGPGGSFIGRNASAGRRHPGGYNKFRYSDAQVELNRIIKSEEFLKQSDFQKVTVLNDFILKHENNPDEKNVLDSAKEALADVVKRIKRSGSPVGKIANWLGDKGKKLAFGLEELFEEEAATKKTVKVKIKKKVEENEEWDKQDTSGHGGGVTSGTKERLKNKYGKEEPEKKTYDWKKTGGNDPETW